MIELKKEGLSVYLHIQVDTMAYKIPNFLDKVVNAGAAQIFIGLENINSDNLEASKKRQNRIEDYKEMVLAWKQFPVIVTCGYIIGFPNDTKEAILRDVDTIKRELAIDNLYVNYLTPLPGSEDHKKLYEAGVWMDPDMNKYTLTHRVTHHPRMSDADWDEAYREFHARYFSFAHMETVLRRMVALRNNLHKATINRMLSYREAIMAEGVSMLESGYVRVRRRDQRRSGLPRENPLVFYPWHAYKVAKGMGSYLLTLARLHIMLRRILADPESLNYMDAAITPNHADVPEDRLVEATRVTAYARKRMTNGARAQAAL